MSEQTYHTSLQTVHKEYLEESKMRPCTRCKDLSIPASVPDYYNLCEACVKYQVPQKPKRFCEICNLPNISATEPYYIKKCGECSEFFAKTSLTTHKQCGACGKFAIPKADSWKDRCVDCYRDNKSVSHEYVSNNYISCTVCNLPKILKSESWRKMCGACFKESKTKCKECGESLGSNPTTDICPECDEMTRDMMRDCSECGEATIPYNAHQSKSTCNSCASLKPMRPCSVCKEAKISESEPKWKNTCLSCFIAKKKAGGR